MDINMLFDQCSRRRFWWTVLYLVGYFIIKVLLKNYGIIKYYHAGTMDTSEQVKVTAAIGEAQSFSCGYWTGSVCSTCLSLFTFWLTSCDNCDLLSLVSNLLIDYFGNINLE
jgi:uncharacterized membrane protein YhaH (DUF805 family)